VALALTCAGADFRAKPSSPPNLNWEGLGGVCARREICVRGEQGQTRGALVDAVA